MVKMTIGIILLIIGVPIFLGLLFKLPSGASFGYMLGYFLPSGIAIALGVGLIAWAKAGKPKE